MAEEYTEEQKQEYEKRMIKKEAKALAKRDGIKYTQALRQVKEERNR